MLRTRARNGRRIVVEVAGTENDGLRCGATSRVRRRIASPEMLPWRGALPHVKCSPGRSHREHWNEESEHDGTHRLRLAGCEVPLFEPPAIEALFQGARGLPRLIKRIAHYALLAAALDNARTVSAEHIHNALKDLQP